MRRASNWLHLLWGSLGFLWVLIECPSGWSMPPPPFSSWWKPASGDLNLNWCIIYSDDRVIFLKISASHLKMLEAMFQKLEQARLKLKPSKCELFCRQITYLGHTVSVQGIATDKGKTDVIRKWPTPTTITEVWSFLEFMGYYCWFIPKLACKLVQTHAWTDLW